MVHLEQVPKILSDSRYPSSVIPANAGIQVFQYVLDPGFRRGDDHAGLSVPDKIMDNCYMGVAKKSCPIALERTRYLSLGCSYALKPV
jgi:hypothetical protein